MNANIKLRNPANLEDEALEAPRLPSLRGTAVPVETMPGLGSAVTVEKVTPANLDPAVPNKNEVMAPVIAAIEQIVKAFMPAMSRFGNKAWPAGNAVGDFAILPDVAALMVRPIPVASNAVDAVLAVMQTLVNQITTVGKELADQPDEALKRLAAEATPTEISAARSSLGEPASPSTEDPARNT
jgi:hypothetical protein